MTQNNTIQHNTILQTTWYIWYMVPTEYINIKLHINLYRKLNEWMKCYRRFGWAHGTTVACNEGRLASSRLVDCRPGPEEINLHYYAYFLVHVDLAKQLWIDIYCRPFRIKKLGFNWIYAMVITIRMIWQVI